MINQFRTRTNSKTVTQNLLQMSDEGVHFQNIKQNVSKEFLKACVQNVWQKQQQKEKQTLRSTGFTFKSYSSFQRKKSMNSKSRDFVDDFLTKKQILLTKISVRYDRVNMVLRDESQITSKSFFMSKKLIGNRSSGKKQRHSILGRNNFETKNNSEIKNQDIYRRICIKTQQQKIKKLNSMQQLQRKYTLISRLNRTTI